MKLFIPLTLYLLIQNNYEHDTKIFSQNNGFVMNNFLSAMLSEP